MEDDYGSNVQEIEKIFSKPRLIFDVAEKNQVLFSQDSSLHPNILKPFHFSGISLNSLSNYNCFSSQTLNQLTIITKVTSNKKS